MRHVLYPVFGRILDRSKHLGLLVHEKLLQDVLSLSRSQRYPQRVWVRSVKSFILESIGLISIMASICYKTGGLRYIVNCNEFTSIIKWSDPFILIK